jgi:broad specificity phosphatase PhoE
MPLSLQAVAARERLSELLKKHGHVGSTLWLSSPLTRALETMTLAAPHVEQLAAAQQGVGAPKVVVSR